MSGGSLDYAFYNLADLAERIYSRAETPAHRAFAAHLDKVAEAAKALEWMWSGDTSPGDEVEAIMAVVSQSGVIEEATMQAEKALSDLQIALSGVRSV